jgi:hypothetical protein
MGERQGWWPKLCVAMIFTFGQIARSSRASRPPTACPPSRDSLRGRQESFHHFNDTAAAPAGGAAGIRHGGHQPTGAANGAWARISNCPSGIDTTERYVTSGGRRPHSTWGPDNGGDLLLRVRARECLEVESGGLTGARVAAQTARGFLARRMFGQRRNQHLPRQAIHGSPGWTTSNPFRRRRLLPRSQPHQSWNRH